MRIPTLPQVEFDSFPTDESTKVCIFTKLPYPIPDLSHVIKDGRSLVLYCTESTVLTVARFAKRLPIELFRLLPIGTNWSLIDSTIVDGLNTPFKVACLPTGSVSDSVMLMISLLKEPKNMTLYTGTFQKCSEALLSDFFIKYSRSFNDIYIDNTFANSKHLDIIQNARACYDIMKIVKAYPKYKIHLQMEMFGPMDLLVELAQRHHINVKLNILQQIFFYKSPYKHLFQYDVQIPNAANVNRNFKFKNHSEVWIVPYEAAEMGAYKMYFDKKKIITVRLIASEREIDVKPETIKTGLVYITYVGHAGAITLQTFLHATNPKRIHPIIDDGPDENTMSRISTDILNNDCEIVYDSQSGDAQCLEVTLDDIGQCGANAICDAPKPHSFLHITTVLPDDKASGPESLLDEIGSPDDTDRNQTVESSLTSFGPAIIEISDDESETIDAPFRSPKKKRTLQRSESQGKSKQFKPNDTNGNEIETMPQKSIGKQLKLANESPICIPCSNNETVELISTIGSYEDASSLSSDPQLVFPMEYS